MATTVPNNPFDTTQQQFSGMGDVVGSITGGARNGSNWDFMDQKGNVLTSVPYQDFVSNYQSDGSGAVRSGVTSVNGIPVYNFSGQSASQPTADASIAPASTPVASAQPTPTGLISGALASQPATSAPSGNVNTFTPTTSAVNPATETAAGQVESLLSKDSPLLQRARTLATQQMAQRGLVNSSMSQGAGVAAMMDKITPIAQQDAQTYANRTLANQDATNTAGMFNAGEENKYKLQTAQQNFVQAQAALDRAQQITLADKSIAAQQELQRAQQTFQAAQSELDRAQQTNLQSSQQTFQAGQANLDRTQQATLAAQQIAATERLTLTQIAATEKNLNTSNTAQMEILKTQITNAQTETGKAYAANLAGQATAQINAIIADGNLDATAKQAAIDNVIRVANSNLQWASTFYNTPLPSYTAPGGTAGTLTPGNGAGTSFPASNFNSNIKNYVTGVLNGTGTTAQKAAAINASATAAGITRDQIASAMGMSVAEVNAYLNQASAPATTGLISQAANAAASGTPAPAAGPAAQAAQAAAAAPAAPAPAVSNAAVSSYVANVMSGSGSAAEKAAAINAAAESSGVSREQIAAATGYSLAQVNQFLG